MLKFAQSLQHSPYITWINHDFLRILSFYLKNKIAELGFKWAAIHEFLCLKHYSKKMIIIYLTVWKLKKEEVTSVEAWREGFVEFEGVWKFVQDPSPWYEIPKKIGNI